MTQRLIIEMGMGTDLHGDDYTKAAIRAVQDCLGRSALAVLSNVSVQEVRVTVGVQRPEQVQTDALADLLPQARDKVRVQVTKGGLDPVGGAHVIASAAIEVFLAPQTGWRIKPAG